MPVRPQPPRTPNNSPIPELGPSQIPTTFPTPGCLERVNAALARAQTDQPVIITTSSSTTPHTRLVTTILASPKLDIYANRPQHQMVYYCATHMLFFSVIVYFRVTKSKMLEDWEKRTAFPPTVVFAWFDELLPFCILTCRFSPFQPSFLSPPPFYCLSSV